MISCIVLGFHFRGTFGSYVAFHAYTVTWEIPGRGINHIHYRLFNYWIQIPVFFQKKNNARTTLHLFYIVVLMHGWVHVHGLLYMGEERWCFNKQAYTLTNNSKIQGWPGKLIIKISGHGFSVTAYSVKWIIRYCHIYSPWRFLIHLSSWIRIKLYSAKPLRTPTTQERTKNRFASLPSYPF